MNRAGADISMVMLTFAVV